MKWVVDAAFFGKLLNNELSKSKLLVKPDSFSSNWHSFWFFCLKFRQIEEAVK